MPQVPTVVADSAEDADSVLARNDVAFAAPDGQKVFQLMDRSQTPLSPRAQAAVVVPSERLLVRAVDNAAAAAAVVDCIDRADLVGSRRRKPVRIDSLQQRP